MESTGGQQRQWYSRCSYPNIGRRRAKLGGWISSAFYELPSLHLMPGNPRRKNTPLAWKLVGVSGFWTLVSLTHQSHSTIQPAHPHLSIESEAADQPFIQDGIRHPPFLHHLHYSHRASGPFILFGYLLYTLIWCSPGTYGTKWPMALKWSSTPLLLLFWVERDLRTFVLPLSLHCHWPKDRKELTHNQGTLSTNPKP